MNDHDLFSKHEFDGEFNGETLASLLSERALLQEECWSENESFRKKKRKEWRARKTK